jgi:RNA polymerase sigma-70 factor (ECF subfamily)
MDENDEVLVARYARGNTAALATLFDRYRKPLYSFIRRMSVSPHEAEEVFQDVWVKVIRNARTYRKARFRGWVFRIAHNLIIDRARCRKVVWSLDAPLEDGADETAWVDHLPASGPSPAAALTEREVSVAIREAVNQLSPEQREVFLLRVEGNVPFREIAEMQGVSINTALARMQYAINRLRRLLPREVKTRESKP